MLVQGAERCVRVATQGAGRSSSIGRLRGKFQSERVESCRVLRVDDECSFTLLICRAAEAQRCCKVGLESRTPNGE